MVTGGNPETSDIVINDTPDGRLGIVVCRKHTVDGERGSNGDGEEGDPLDVPK